MTKKTKLYIRGEPTKGTGLRVGKIYGLYINLPKTVTIPEGEATEKAEVCITYGVMKKLMTFEEFLTLIFQDDKKD